MAAFKPQQRHLTIRGRTFHFVSYEGTPANIRRGEPLQPAMWYLMVEGRRFPAFACDPAQPLPELDRALELWATTNAMGPVEPAPSPSPGSQSSRTGHRMTWWGPS
jgi:hypothetical protein